MKVAIDYVNAGGGLEGLIFDRASHFDIGDDGVRVWDDERLIGFVPMSRLLAAYKSLKSAAK